MDSIGDNVMAIICVVVGILIIGCALVPIVENASTDTIETQVTQEVTGNNTLNSTDESRWIGPISEIVATSTGTSLTVDGVTVTAQYYLSFYEGLSTNTLVFVKTYDNYRISVRTLFDGTDNATLVSGTISYADGVLRVTGTNVNDGTEYDKSKTVTELYVNGALMLQNMVDADVYGPMTSEFKIGEEQKCVSQNGETVITMDTETLPSGMTMTVNDNHTATITTTSGTWYGPYEWVGYTTTTETTTSESEYAGLYNMIPVLCILGMAYVLIRRFY